MVEFEEIYARYFSSVYRYAWRLTRDENLAEELTAETFFKALKNLSNYDEDKADVRIWLCQIAKNTWISQCRKQGRELPLPEEPSAQAFSIERVLEDKETARRLHSLLHRMEEPYKEVFSLRVFSELPFAGAAQIGAIEIPPPRVVHENLQNCKIYIAICNVILYNEFMR